MSCEEMSLSSDARRRAADAGGAIQGIDYIEVLDHEAPNDDLRRRILLVHCFDSLEPVGDINVRIEGDDETTPPRVQWALPAASFVLPGPDEVPLIVADRFAEPRPVTEDELSFFARMSDMASTLIVHVAPQRPPAEDRATYRLWLALGDGTVMDPRLEFARFSLNSEGPLDIDCKPLAFRPRTRYPSPPIDYLAKDYASFRRLMLDRMSVIMPEWDERSPADVGVALVELLAHVGDQLSYYQDAVATEAYLGTARQRISVHRHARILDYYLHEGNNARVWISFEVNQDYDSEVYPEEAMVIPAGAHLITRLEHESRTGLQADALSEALRQSALHFETLQPIRPRPIRNCIPLYDWGGGIRCLSRGATKATLAGIPEELDIVPGDVLIFEEIDDCITGAEADSTRRHAVCIVAIKELEDQLDLVTNPETQVSEPRRVTEVVWHGDDALPFAMPLRYPSGAQATIARGNVVLADHGRTIHREPLVPELAPPQERYRPYLRGLDLTHRVPDTPADLRARSAQAQLVQDPRRSRPAITVFEVTGLHDEEPCRVGDDHGTPWYPYRDLLASGPFDRHVTVEMASDGRARLRFGDNVNGRLPTRGSRWQATYRLGNGSTGNIGADAIAHVLVPMDLSERSSMMLHGIEVARNPLPAVGGNNPERDTQARLYAPYSFREGARAVTADDYAKLTERHPEVQKAVAHIRWTGSWDTVFVTVDRRGGHPLDASFETTLRSFLEPFRMAGQDIEFEPPRFVPLDIALTVHAAPDYLRSEVKAALLAALGSGEDASGRLGFFHPDKFTFGDPVYLSHIVATAMKVPGVVWVDVDDTPPKPNRFQRFGEEPRGEIGKGVITVAPLEIIRVDNDPTAPHHGRIQLFMEGGL